MRSVMRAVCALCLLLAACGDEEKQSAKDKCETLVDTFCETVTSCAEDADLLEADYPARELMADCKDTVGDSAHCEDAKEIGSRYDACLSAAGEKLSCEESNDALLFDDTFAVPAACSGVILY